MARRKNELPQAVRVGIWDRLMDGDTPTEIARYSHQLFRNARLQYDECSVTQVRQVLSETPPPEIADDLRFRFRVRPFWISADGDLGDVGTADSFVIAFQPWRLSTRALHRGVRGICRDFRSRCPTGRIDPQIIEAFEMEHALRRIENHGAAAWIIDEEGTVRHYRGEFSIGPTPDESAGPSGP